MASKLSRIISVLLLFSYITSGYVLPNSALSTQMAQEGYAACTAKKECKKPGKLACFFKEVLSDVVQVNWNLISWDTFKLISIFFPLFVGTRMIDEKVQNCFYDRAHHKNIHQPPAWVHDAAQYSIGIPIVLLGSYAFFENDFEKKQAGRLLLLGLPFVIWGKTLLKKIRMRACYRPWNEHFSRKCRSLGGLPSGHMAEAMYSAVLFGSRFGPKYAVPLGLLAAFVGAAFLVCNRHYASQLVAGAGLGTIYAVSANKVIDKKLCDCWSAGMEFDHNTTPMFSIDCRF